MQNRLILALSHFFKPMYGVWLLISGMIALLMWGASYRFFDPDEFQHLQMAWLIGQGERPYLDFFEHHTPLYHFLASLSLLSPALTVDGNAAIKAVLRLRYINVGLSVVVVGMIWRQACLLWGKKEAILSALFLVSSSYFIAKGLEIRPDPLAAFFLLSAAASISRQDRVKAKGYSWGVAGVCFALAVMTTQKSVYALPGFLVSLALFCRDGGYRFFLKQLMCFIAGGIAGCLPFVIYFGLQGSLPLFITNTFLLGFDWLWLWKEAPTVFISFGAQDGIVLILGCLGLACLAQDKSKHQQAAWCFLAPSLSMLALMPLFPVVRGQYFYLLSPFLALLAGKGAAYLIERIKGQITTKVFGILVFGLGLHGLCVFAFEMQESNTNELEILSYVVEQTKPEATVLTSWSTGVAFRKPAFFYYSMNEEIFHIIPHDQINKIKSDLLNKTLQPDLIDMDRAFMSNFPGMYQQMMQLYVPANQGTLWKSLKYISLPPASLPPSSAPR